MKNKPLVSIIVPIYRVEEFLDQCIQSIIGQSYQNLEIILVDDGSDDGCPQICDRYSTSDSRIRVIHKSNGGQHSARQAAMRIANGEYIGYVDGDDWIEPEMYERLVSIAEEEKVDVVFCGAFDVVEGKKRQRKLFFEEGKYIGKRFIDEIEPYILYTGNFYNYGISVNLWDKLFRKSIVEKYQMMTNPKNPRELLANDNMVAIPSIIESKSLYIVQEYYYNYRERYDGSAKRRKYYAPDIIRDSYYDWLRKCSFAEPSSKIEWQLQINVIAFLFQKNPEFYDDRKSPLVLNLYGGMERGSRIAIYGAGVSGINLVRYIDKEKPVELVCWVDRNYKRINSLGRDYLVQSPEVLLNEDYDYICLTVSRHDLAIEIQKNITDMGISLKKVRWIDTFIIDTPEWTIDRLFANKDTIR